MLLLVPAVLGLATGAFLFSWLIMFLLFNGSEIEDGQSVPRHVSEVRKAALLVCYLSLLESYEVP